MAIRGFDFNYTRVHIINSLIRNGGELKSKNCTRVLYEDMILHGMDSRAMKIASLPSKLKEMEDEGYILRDVNNKRTLEIVLILEAIPNALMAKLELSSPLNLPAVVETASKVELETESHEVTAEAVAAELLSKVVQMVLSQESATTTTQDENLKAQLGIALGEVEQLEISLSSARARIASLQQENQTLQNNVEKLARNRVVIDDRVGKDLLELVTQPKSIR